MEEITNFNLPKQTHDIFAVMARGAFISSNGSRDGMNRLYDVINNPENFDRLQAYFNVIRYNIERGNNFFYFSKLSEPNSELEPKIVINCNYMCRHFKSFSDETILQPGPSPYDGAIPDYRAIYLGQTLNS